MPSSTLRSAVCPSPISRSGAAETNWRDPLVVGVEAGLLVVDVGVVAQEHPDRRVEHLGLDAVAVLLGQPGHRIPAARVQLVPADIDVRADLVPAAAGGGHHAVRDHRAPVVDRHGRAHHVVRDRDRRPVAVGRIDERQVAVAGLGDVGVGGDGGEGHVTPWSAVTPPRKKGARTFDVSPRCRVRLLRR